jgi:hypothetical protein
MEITLVIHNSFAHGMNCETGNNPLLHNDRETRDDVIK